MKRIGFIDGRRVAGWNFPATLTPGNGQVVDVTDPSAGAVSNVIAQTLKFRPTGIKTGVNYLSAHRIEVYPYGDTYILRGQSIEFATPGRAAIVHRYFGQEININQLGPAVGVSEIGGVSIEMNYTVPTTLPHSGFIRLYTHGAVAMPTAIRLAGSGTENLIYFQRSVIPFRASAVGAIQTGRIRCHCADTGQDWDIALYEA